MSIVKKQDEVAPLGVSVSKEVFLQAIWNMVVDGHGLSCHCQECFDIDHMWNEFDKYWPDGKELRL